MGELLSENEQLAVRNLQILDRRRGCCALSCFRFRFRSHQFDADRDTLLQFNLPDRKSSISAVEHAFNEAALGIAGTVSELWHRRGKISGNLESQTGI